MMYAKPNMSNLQGREGKEIITAIRETKPANHEIVRKEAEACKERLMMRRKNER